MSEFHLTKKVDYISKKTTTLQRPITKIFTGNGAGNEPYCNMDITA